MDFGEFMASWEPIPRTEDNHEAHPITTVPLSSRPARNAGDNFTNPDGSETWLDPTKFTGKTVSKSLSNEPNFNDRLVTSTEIEYSNDIPKENTNPDASASGIATATTDAGCTRKLKRKVMVLPPSESYRGFCSVDDIRNVDKRPWENLSQVKSQKVKQKIETASSQVNSKQVKIMRLVSPERIASSVGVKNRKICTLQSSPVRDFNVKMIKPSLNKISEPPPNQNKYRSDTTTKSTSISSSSKAITQRKSLETKKKVMKISSSDNRRHEDFDDHFNNLLKEAKAINSQMESLKKSTLDGENSDDVQIKVAPHKPKFVKKLGNTFSSPQKAIKKPTEREDDTNVDKKNDITKKYDRQAALSYMKQKKALMKEKQAKEIDKKRCDEENKQQKLQELQVTRLKLLSNARKKKDATEARRNWEGPVNGESSPPPPLPIHRSNSDVKIRHISRKPGTEQNSCTKSNTIKQSVENIEIGPSFVPVNGENCVNPTWKTKSTKQNVENLEVGPSFVGVAGNCINSNRKTNSNRQNVHSTEFVPSFVVVNEGNCVNSNRKSNFTKQHVENIEISPSFVPINGENYLNLKEVGNHDGGINCEEQVVRGPVASKSKDSIADRNENFENNCPPNLRSREILGSKSVGIFDEAEVQKQQIEENLEENKINSNSSSFVPFYEDEMREITNQINQIGAALKNITGRKVVDKTVGSEDDKKGNRGRTDEDVTKKNDERRSGGDVSKTPVENKGSWCELLRSKDRSRKERKKQYEEENESSDQPHTTTQDESISGGPINELTDEENLYQALPNESSHRQHTSTKPAKDEKIVPQFIKALDYEPNPLNFITAYRSKLDMLKRQNKRDRISAEGNRNKSAVQKNFPHFKTCSGSKFKENLTLKDLETCPENGLSSRRNTQNRIYVLTDESSDLVSRQNVFQPLLLNDLKLDLPPSLKSDTTSGKNSTTDGCESEEIIVNGTVGKENNFGNRIVDDRLFKAKSDSQLEKDKQQRLFVSDSVKSLTLSHSLTTLENKMAAETKTKNEKSGSSGSSMSLSAPNDCVRVSGSTVWRENVGVGGGTSWRDNVSDGGPFRRENDGVRLANSDAVEFVEPKRVCRERPRKTTLPSGAQLEGGGVLEIGNVFSPAAIHLQFQAELSKLDAYEVGLQQLTDSERLHNMALKSLHNQAKYEKLHKSTSIDNFDGKQNTQHSAASNHSDVDEPIVLTSSHHSVSSSSLSSSSNPTNHRDSRQKELSSSLRTVAESISSDSQHVKQVSESLKKPSDRLFDDTSLRRSFEKVGSSLNLPVPELQPPGDSNLGVMNPSEGPQHSSILEQTIATLISNPGAQVLDSLLNESNGLEQLLSSAHALTPLFDEQSSCGSPFPSSCSNSIFDKCISYEEARSDHQLNMYKSKEKELINRVKVQVSWLEFQKKRLKQKGHEDEAKNIKKKQRGLILKSQQIREEIHRLMKAEKMASEERRKLLHQQKLRAMHQLSVKDSSKKRKTNEVALKKSLQSLSSSTTSIAESLLTGEEASAFSEPKSLVVEEQKRHLLERKKAAIGRNRNSDVLSPNKRRFEEKELNLEEVDHRNIKSPKHTVSRSVLDRSTSPFAISSIESELVETTGVGLEAVKSHSETDPTEHTHREAQNDNDNSVPEELAKSNHSDSVDSHVTEELHQYSESTFEQPSFTIHSRQPTPLKTRTDQSDSRSSQTKTASERRTTLSNMMIPIKVALSPRLQGYTRKRYSSGSEDSITFSQNETFSEQSDIEIRLSALHEQLRQRKLEADRLRREQKRAQRERLKCKEQALLKQIQIYDAYIEQVKKELEQEIESPSTVPIMKPQIKQPRFVDNDLRKPETVKPEPEKKTATSSDEEMSSLKSVSEASSLETTIQSLGQRDSSVDEQQITEKVSSSAASSPPLSEKFSKVLGENVPEVSSAALPKNHEEISKNLDPKMGDSEPEVLSSPQSVEFSKNLASKIEDSVSEVSSVTSPLHSGQILKKLEGSASEKAENLGNVDSELDKTTEKWVAAAEFFKNKFSIDSPSNKSVERIRKTNNYDNNIKAGENIGEFSENNVNNVEILTSVESSYSEKSNSEETLSEVEEILGDNGENSVESEKNVESIENSVESEKKSDSVESIVEQIETKSEENGSDSFEVNTEKGFSGESLDRQEDFDKCLEEQNDRIRKSSSKSSVDDSEVNSSKSPDSTKNDNKSSVILEVTPDESLVIKTAQSVIDNEPSVLVDSSALNRSSLAVSTNSKSSPALELNPYDSADDTFESDVEASENESSVPESKHSSNLSIPDMFPLPMAGAEGHTSVSEGHKSVTDGQRSVTEGQRSVSEGHKSPEGHKSGDLLLNDVGKYFLVEKSVEVPDSTNQTLILSIVDCSERLICEERQDTSSLDEKSIRNETTVASLGDELIRNETSVASFGDELIHKEGSVANLDDKLIRNITPIANLEGKLIDDKTPVADLEEQLIRKETSVASLEDKLIRVGSFVANSEETLEDILVQSEVSEEDVLSEVSEALSYSKEDSEFDNLSAATKSCSSSSESSEFTVQKKAKVVSLNSTDSSEKSNQDYDGSFKEDEVIKVILVEKEKIINTGEKQDFVQVREEGEVEEDDEGGEVEEGDEEFEEDVEVDEEGEDEGGVKQDVSLLGENFAEKDVDKESRIDRITDNILLNLLNESLKFSPKVSASNKQLIHEENESLQISPKVSSSNKQLIHKKNCVLSDKIVNGSEEENDKDENEEKEEEDIQTTAPFITALRKENEREKRKSVESVTDKVLEEFIKDATDSVLKIYGKKTGEKLLKLQNTTDALPSSGSAASPPPGGISDLNSRSKDSSFDSNDGSWLKDEAENELEVSGGETEAFWLEEEMGLEHSCKEARELQLQRLQIEQEIKQLQQVQEQIPSYFYFREIPNKPPPPYTPPGQARAKIANDRIPTKQQEILAIVNSLTDYIYTQHSLGKDINALTPPRNLITREDSSQGIYKRFLFDLTKQIVIEAKYRYEEEDAQQRLPWQRIDYKQKCVVARELDELKKVVAKRVKVLYGFEPQVNRENLIVQWSKKHNKIDKFLVNELQEEECEWTDFSKQELMVKNKVAEDLMEQLIGETASVLEKSLARKVDRLSRMGVDDT